MGVAARLTAYALALVLVFAAAWFAGGLVRPAPDAPQAVATPAATTTCTAPTASTPRAPPTGSPPPPRATGSPSSTPRSSPGVPSELRFTVIGPDGLPVTAFTPPRATRARCTPWSSAATPRASSASTRPWTRTAPGAPRCGCPRPGVWRAFVDMTPTAGPALVLGVDLFAAGPFDPFTFPPSRTAQIGDFQLRLDGDLVPGASSQVFATVSRDGVGVTDLQPYLGAFGKLVALREGDLAYTAAAPGNGAGPARHRPRGPRGRVHRQRPERRDLPPLPAVPRGRCHAHRGVHRADEEPMTTQIDLTIGGMTCASCANRVERKLNKLDGVVATRQLRHREGARQLPRRARPGRARRGGRGGGLHGRAAPPSPAGSRPDRVRPAQPLPGRHGAGRAGGRAVHGPGAAVPRLGVGRARARRARRRLGRVAAAPRGRDQPAPRHGHDGHAHLARHPRRAGLVGRRARCAARA